MVVVGICMYKLELALTPLLLKKVEFSIDGKILKHGAVRVFNTKQFFIRFKLEQDNRVIEYDLPYPFKLRKEEDGYIFDYCLSSFCPKTEETYWKMVLMDKSNASKLHNTYLKIKMVN